MRKTRQKGQEKDAAGLIVVYARLHPEDYAELNRREETTGATIAAQIRILVHNALQAERKEKVLR